MADSNLGLQNVTMNELFLSGEKCTYEIPIYQRNYAWADEEINALIDDVYYASKRKEDNKPVDYYIGTLVVYNRGDHRYEVIDGQQRLTTIWLILSQLKKMDPTMKLKNHLTYAARKKSADMLEAIMENPDQDLGLPGEADNGIEHGVECVRNRLKEIFRSDEEKKQYLNYWETNVRIVRYIVPEGTDLNQYFEVMNSRGEQLEMHEIVKARLVGCLDGPDAKTEQKLFETIWEACSNMSDYVQKNMQDKLAVKIFGKRLDDFALKNFDELLEAYQELPLQEVETTSKSILDILRTGEAGEQDLTDDEVHSSFQPIIDFPNFLLIVLKVTKFLEDNKPSAVTLDDKNLLEEFWPDGVSHSAKAVKDFAYNLLKARFFLDNYMVHHTKEQDQPGFSPWNLQIWSDRGGEKAARNLCFDEQDEEDAKDEQGRTKLQAKQALQNDLTKLLSMFEVSYSARQRKNYLFYCLAYLMQQPNDQKIQPADYRNFVSRLADSYFYKVYLNKEKLNEHNVPVPNSFDEMILPGGRLDSALIGKDPIAKENAADTFNDIYGTGETADTASKGVPLFVFNYLDYRIWKLYADNVRGTKDTAAQSTFFNCLGCSDFGLDALNTFYFSRTRRSLEHYFPQANVDNVTTEAKINCFGNYAMISSDANTRGSNMPPQEKIRIYLDGPKKKSFRKTAGVGTASLKLLVMMQMCSDRGHWNYDDMKEHQEKMVTILTQDLQDHFGQNNQAVEQNAREQGKDGESGTV